MLIAEPVDVEALVIARLLTIGEITSEVDDRIGTKFPADWPTSGPAIRVFRYSGSDGERPGWIQKPRIQVDVAGADVSSETATFALTAKVHRAVFDLIGTHDLGTVTDVARDLPLQNAPDPETSIPAYRFGAILTLHPPRS